MRNNITATILRCSFSPLKLFFCFSPFLFFFHYLLSSIHIWSSQTWPNTANHAPAVSDRSETRASSSCSRYSLFSYIFIIYLLLSLTLHLLLLTLSPSLEVISPLVIFIYLATAVALSPRCNVSSCNASQEIWGCRLCGWYVCAYKHCCLKYSDRGIEKIEDFRRTIFYRFNATFPLSLTQTTIVYG